MMYFLSKIIWSYFNPFNLLIILILISFFFRLVKYSFISKFFSYLVFFLFIIFAILPTGSYLNYLLEKDFHLINDSVDNIHGILILSGATNPFLSNEHNQIILNNSSERLIESVFLINKYPAAKIIFSGGLGHGVIAKKFYNNMKINTNKIIFEDKSRNTYENILFSKEIAKPKINEKWLLVTSAFHLRRSLSIAEKLQWDFIPYPTDFNNSKTFNFKLSFNLFLNMTEFQKASHEWIGILSYYYLGRSAKIFN